MEVCAASTPGIVLGFSLAADAGGAKRFWVATRVLFKGYGDWSPNPLHPRWLTKILMIWLGQIPPLRQRPVAGKVLFRVIADNALPFLWQLHPDLGEDDPAVFSPDRRWKDAVVVQHREPYPAHFMVSVNFPLYPATFQHLPGHNYFLHSAGTVTFL